MSKYSNGRPYPTSGHKPISGRRDKLLPLERLDSTVTKLCDLHVYKVPTDLWRENFNNILNNVVTETISIGIIRVPPETPLADLRDEIIQQLQIDDLGPRDWVFLRSVGRSLTRLRTKQEYLLKAKHFLPPVSFAPELYILEATPEVRDALAISERGSSQSPPVSRRTSPSHRAYNNSYRNGYGGELDPAKAPRSGRDPASPVQRYHALPHIDGRPTVTDHTPRPAHSPPPDRPAQQYNTYDHDHPNYNDSNNHDHSNYNNNHNNYQDRYNGNNTYRVPSPKPHTDTRHTPTAQSPTRHTTVDPHDRNIPWAERDHHRRAPATPEAERWGEQWQQAPPVAAGGPRIEARAAPVASAAPAPWSRDRASPDKSASRDYHRRPDDDSGVAEMSPDDDYNNSSSSRNNNNINRRDDYDALARRLESDRFNLDDESEEERRRRLEDLEGRNMMDRRRWENDQEERRRQAEEDRKREEEEKRRREEDEKRRKEEEDEEDRRRRAREDEERREAERKKREEEEEEERRRQAAKEEEEQLRNEAKSPEDDPMRRDTESARQRRRDEMAQLLKEAEEARQARQDQEREREELVKKAKALQHKTTNRRNDARDLWKKKYFEEKKKTTPLEENSNRLRQELEALHRRLMNTLEGPKEKNPRLLDAQPSRKNNYVIQCTKLQHDIEDLQRRVANAKMKLTAEMKLRNQAQGELRALRADLAQRKHNINKARQQQLAALTPRPLHDDPGKENSPQYGRQHPVSSFEIVGTGENYPPQFGEVIPEPYQGRARGVPYSFKT